jgi:cryptochrome
VLVSKMKEWNVGKLCFESDTEPYAKVRDAQLAGEAEGLGVDVFSAVSNTLYDPSILISKNGGKAPMTMQSFQKLVDKVGPPPAPAADPPSELPACPLVSDGGYGVPSMKEIGYGEEYTKDAKKPVDGGETAALARLAKYMADEAWVAAFEKPKGNPAAFTPYPATTMLSPYLKFGCLSSRLFYQKLKEVYSRQPHHTKPPVSLYGQLLWREFFYCASVSVPNFGRMNGNPMCKQIDWDTNEEYLRAWEQGRTGYPWIDAIMNQLRQEGWMHHLARHSVACFLTRGDLYCSWEDGAAVFDKYLLDADWAINSGNWQWLSASAFFSQYFRVYSPVSFGKQYDKNGDYIRKYIPALEKMPAKYIYEPWTAPAEVQRAANCIVGVDYPKPIVDHATIHKENMARMKKAYEENKKSQTVTGVKRK